MRMTVALTPEPALAYLAALSVDVSAAAVLGAGGTCLAGEEALARLAGGLLDGRPPGEVIVSGRGRDRVFAVRSTSHAVAVRTGRFALAALVAADVLGVLDDLAAPG